MKPITIGLKNAMARGFTSLKAGSIFSAIAEKARAEQVSQNLPTSIWDIYDMLPSLVATRMGIPAVIKPHFLKSVIERLDKAVDSEDAFALHTPPRHGKTLMIHASFIYYHMTRPGLIHMYMTYSVQFAAKQMRQFCDILKEMKIEHEVWHDEVYLAGGANKGGTTIYFKGVKGAVAGNDISGIIFVDDAVANDEKAMNPKQRDKLWDVILDINTRKMGKLSMCVVMTRWNKDDIVGRLIAKHGWDYVCLPALKKGDDDKLIPLWDRYDVQHYLDLMAGQSEKTWAAKYQGDPFPEGDRWFNATLPLYDELPKVPLQWSIGIDAGYSGTSGDWSVATVLARDPSTGFIYIVKVVRKMIAFQKFIDELRLLTYEYPGATLTWLYGGQEREIAKLLSSDMMKAKLTTIRTIPSEGKATNASYFQDAWNDGLVLAPRQQSTNIKTFITNIADFTGYGDAHDDDMDSMSSGMHGFNNVSRPIPKPLTVRHLGGRASPIDRRKLMISRFR